MSHHHPPSADDLLSFKEFDHGRSAAQININSPTRAAIGGGSSTAQPSAFDENFQSLIDDMNTVSINMMASDADNARTSAGRSMPASSVSDATSLEDDDAIGRGAAKPANFSFFTIEYYQQFFDVDTAIVSDRILNSVVPRRASATYLRQNIGKNPDLYGPFWIVVTLVFCIAISGNVASYMQHASTNYHWRYNFHLVSTAATTIVMYVCLVPVGLWAALKWFVRPNDPDIETDSPYVPGLLTLICIYGYSLAIYIPVSILWAIQISALQWLLVLSATFLSGSVLIIVLSPALRNARGSPVFAAAIVFVHFLLAAGFMLYFFHVPESIAPPVQEHLAETIAAATAAAVPAAAAPSP